MMLLLRLLVTAALIGGLAYAGLSWLGGAVQPEPREIAVDIPFPKHRP